MMRRGRLGWVAGVSNSPGPWHYMFHSVEISKLFSSFEYINLFIFYSFTRGRFISQHGNQAQGNIGFFSFQAGILVPEKTR